MKIKIAVLLAGLVCMFGGASFIDNLNVDAAQAYNDTPGGGLPGQYWFYYWICGLNLCGVMCGPNGCIPV